MSSNDHYSSGGGSKKPMATGAVVGGGSGVLSRFKSQQDDEPPFSRVYVQYSKEATQYDLQKSFEKFGFIQDLWVIRDKSTHDEKGVAYIKYSKASEAAKACEEMHDEYLTDKCKRKLKVYVSVARREICKEYVPNDDLYKKMFRVFVNVDKKITKADLKNIFGRWGNVVNTYIINDKETNQSRGLAFLTFSKASEAARVVEEAPSIYRARFADLSSRDYYDASKRPDRNTYGQSRENEDYDSNRNKYHNSNRADYNNDGHYNEKFNSSFDLDWDAQPTSSNYNNDKNVRDRDRDRDRERERDRDRDRDRSSDLHHHHQHQLKNENYDDDDDRNGSRHMSYDDNRMMAENTSRHDKYDDFNTPLNKLPIENVCVQISDNKSDRKVLILDDKKHSSSSSMPNSSSANSLSSLLSNRQFKNTLNTNTTTTITSDSYAKKANEEQEPILLITSAIGRSILHKIVDLIPGLIDFDSFRSVHAKDNQYLAKFESKDIASYAMTKLNGFELSKNERIVAEFYDERAFAIKTERNDSEELLKSLLNNSLQLPNVNISQLLNDPAQLLLLNTSNLPAMGNAANNDAKSQQDSIQQTLSLLLYSSILNQLQKQNDQPQQIQQPQLQLQSQLQASRSPPPPVHRSHSSGNISNNREYAKSSNYENGSDYHKSERSSNSNNKQFKVLLKSKVLITKELVILIMSQFSSLVDVQLNDDKLSCYVYFSNESDAELVVNTINNKQNGNNVFSARIEPCTNSDNNNHNNSKDHHRRSTDDRHDDSSSARKRGNEPTSYDDSYRRKKQRDYNYH